MKTLADVKGRRGKIWVYLSGPNPFIQAGEAACKASGGWSGLGHDGVFNSLAKRENG